jgi:hypothetical protein
MQRPIYITNYYLSTLSLGVIKIGSLPSQINVAFFSFFLSFPVSIHFMPSVGGIREVGEATFATQ